jgi:putative ABC transport system permease protein
MTFSANQFLYRSLRYHWRSALVLALGVAIATAIITGALIVGESMRWSLRDLTQQRLGKIEYVIAPGRFVDAQLIDRIQDQQGSKWKQSTFAPLLLFPTGVVETSPASAAAEDLKQVRRAGSCQLIGCDRSFWAMDQRGIAPKAMPEGDQVIINQPLADELGVGVGDRLTIRLPTEQAVPADSPLGRRDTESSSLPRLTVVAIVPDRGLGRFSLQASQAAPLTAWLPLSLIQEALDRKGQINAILIDDPVAGDDAERIERSDALTEALPLQLRDYGLDLKRVTRSFNPPDGNASTPIVDYYSLTSRSLLLPDAASKALQSSLGPRAVPMMTYLANGIDRVDPDGNVTHTIPYSTITAIDSSNAFPLPYSNAATSTTNSPSTAAVPTDTVATDTVPIVLNSWAAARLATSVGETLRLVYYQPETVGGREVEQSFTARVEGIVPVTAPSKPYRRNQEAVFDVSPTIYNDPELTPEVPGVTDQDSISDWDLPFTLDRKINAEDDRYWNEYRLTPKAFLPLAIGTAKFGSRFGSTTSLRIAIDPSQGDQDQTVLQSKITDTLSAVRGDLGWRVQPIGAKQRAASAGTTPFDVLFLALSFFVIAAALMLIALLVRLNLQQRGAEHGVLMAVGTMPQQVARMATREGGIVAIVGGAIGLLLGNGYAKLLLEGLRRWWVGAVTVPFLQYHASWLSLLVGYVSGVGMAWIAIRWTCRHLHHAPPRVLLAGRAEEAIQSTHRGGKWRWLSIVVWIVAIAMLASGPFLAGPAQAGLFVAGAMGLLVGALLATYQWLIPHQAKPEARKVVSDLSDGRVARRSVTRNPLRSTLTIGLLAIASFLILAMSAFQLRPSGEGVGGFALQAQTAQPIYRDLGDPVARREQLGREEPALASTKIFSFRQRGGDDASCNNLYRAVAPQVLSVPEALVQWFDDPSLTPRFAWAAKTQGLANPWRAIDEAGQGTEASPVPVILDQNTALWSLQLYGGVGQTMIYRYDDRDIHFRVVGLLQNSLLQGKLLIADENFRRVFPQQSGFQFFLIHTAADRASVANVLEQRLSDQGMDVVATESVLERLLAVQNTYLRTFQSLGALGLLLGVLGMAVVQLRSVIERRGELKLMMAIGFSPRRLHRLVVWESVWLLIIGLALGVLTAMAGLLPHTLFGGARPSIVEPMVLVGIVFLVGVVSASVAVRMALRSLSVTSERRAPVA